MPSVDAVCFDLDETLCVSEWTDHEFNNEVFERAGIDPIFSPRDLRAVDPEDIKQESNENEYSDTSDLTGFYTDLYRATIRTIERDIEPDSSLIENLGAIAGDLYDPTAITFREGAKGALEYARERYTLGLITNGTWEVQMTKLEKLGIADAFDTTIICDPHKGIDSKPAQQPFEMALAGLSTRAKMTIHIGDSYGEDILGAYNMGLQSVWAPIDRPHEELQTDLDPAPTYQVESLDGLYTII